MVNTDISVLEFYGYIINIGEISVDILTKISMKQKLSKFTRMLKKTKTKMIKSVSNANFL